MASPDDIQAFWSATPQERAQFLSEIPVDDRPEYMTPPTASVPPPSTPVQRQAQPVHEGTNDAGWLTNLGAAAGDAAYAANDAVDWALKPAPSWKMKPDDSAMTKLGKFALNAPQSLLAVGKSIPGSILHAGTIAGDAIAGNPVSAGDVGETALALGSLGLAGPLGKMVGGIAGPALGAAAKYAAAMGPGIVAPLAQAAGESYVTGDSIPFQRTIVNNPATILAPFAGAALERYDRVAGMGAPEYPSGRVEPSGRSSSVMRDTFPPAEQPVYVPPSGQSSSVMRDTAANRVGRGPLAPAAAIPPPPDAGPTRGPSLEATPDAIKFLDDPGPPATPDAIPAGNEALEVPRASAVNQVPISEALAADATMGEWEKVAGDGTSNNPSGWTHPAARGAVFVSKSAANKYAQQNGLPEILETPSPNGSPGRESPGSGMSAQWYLARMAAEEAADPAKKAWADQMKGIALSGMDEEMGESPEKLAELEQTLMRNFGVGRGQQLTQVEAPSPVSPGVLESPLPPPESPTMIEGPARQELKGAEPRLPRLTAPTPDLPPLPKGRPKKIYSRKSSSNKR